MKNTCKFCGQEKKLIKAHISLSGKFKVKMFNDNAIYYLTSKDYNYEYLRKFFISILWRASISSLPDFRDIQLGQYEQ